MTTKTETRARPTKARTGTGAKIPYGMRRPVIVSLIPAVILFATFFLVPLIVLILTAFSRWGGLDFAMVGLENYQRLATDETFWKAAGNTLFYSLTSIFIQVPLGVLAGMVLGMRLRGWKVFRTIIFIPFVISGAAYALIFSMFYNPRYGLLNNILGPLTGGTRDWLFDTATARWAVAGTFVFILGFIMIVIMAEVAAIPNDLYEAAEVDGASIFQQQWLITLPLLRNAIGTCVLIRLLADIGMFDLVFILTGGGPNDATSTLALYAYRAYVNGEWGYANAVGTVILILGATLIVTVRKAFRIGERAL